MKSMQHRQAQSFLLFLTLYKLILSFDRALGLISLLQEKISYAYYTGFEICTEVSF